MTSQILNSLSRLLESVLSVNGSLRTQLGLFRVEQVNRDGALDLAGSVEIGKIAMGKAPTNLGPRLSELLQAKESASKPEGAQSLVASGELIQESRLIPSLQLKGWMFILGPLNEATPPVNTTSPTAAARRLVCGAAGGQITRESHDVPSESGIVHPGPVDRLPNLSDATVIEIPRKPLGLQPDNSPISKCGECFHAAIAAGAVEHVQLHTVAVLPTDPPLEELCGKCLECPLRPERIRHTGF
jgi:hypothetical protein